MKVADESRRVLQLLSNFFPDGSRKKCIAAIVICLFGRFHEDELLSFWVLFYSD